MQRSDGTHPATGLLDYAAVKRAGPPPPTWWPGNRRTPRSTSPQCGRSPTSACSQGGHGALRRAGRGKALTGDFDLVPHADRHDHHQKSLRARAVGWSCASRNCPARSTGAARWYPAAARAHHRGQGGRAGRGPAARVQDYAQRIADNAQALAEGLVKRGVTLVTGGMDNDLALVDVSGYGPTGRQAEPRRWTPGS